jgi:signal transduction histidine kinase
MLNDVTKQKEVERVKSEFLSTVSHELRTPLVAIEKSVSLILDQSAGAVSDQQKQFLTIAERNLKRLTLLINDLLDLSKLEARKMELKREQMPIEKVITETIETLANWAQTKDIALERSVASGIPDVFIDANRMTQVLTNLIGNSIKFTPKGGRITVDAAFLEQEAKVKVSIIDTGIGIAPEDLPKLFTKFYQAKDRPASDISGTGIGLAIVREIVELHGGSVWAESPAGQGAKFIFTVPAGEPPAEQI